MRMHVFLRARGTPCGGDCRPLSERRAEWGARLPFLQVPAEHHSPRDLGPRGPASPLSARGMGAWLGLLLSYLHTSLSGCRMWHGRHNGPAIRLPCSFHESRSSATFPRHPGSCSSHQPPVPMHHSAMCPHTSSRYACSAFLMSCHQRPTSLLRWARCAASACSGALCVG